MHSIEQLSKYNRYLTKISNQKRETKNMQYYAIAHRGWSGVAPENTLSAFKHALKCPTADVIECDIQLTKDGKIVVIHDFSLDRTSNGTGPVFEHTYEELLQYDFGSWFGKEFEGERIMLFSELLELVQGKKKLMVEFKTIEGYCEGFIDKFLHEIDGYPKDTLMLESFNHNLIKQLKERETSFYTGLIYYGSPTRLLEQLKYTDSNFVSIQYFNITKEMVDELYGAGMTITAWTLNEKWQYDLIKKTGTGLYIASDIPGLAYEQLKEI
jgi:glycerophosphoryl diester phosphodiesterase